MPQKNYPKIVDFCCGVGISTIPWGIGVDTSDAMLKTANCRKKREPESNKHKSFIQGNCETYGEDNSVDAVTCLLATHEMPQEARQKILSNAIRIATKKVIFVDICPTYKAPK